MSAEPDAIPTPLITLYTYAMSPYAAKVHCFLLYKQLDFECFYVNPMRVKEDLPVGREVPVLTVGDESRADSTPIGLWLDELFPDHPRLLPEEGKERDRLLAESRVCVCPSAKEGWGLTVIEANAVGTPVVASDSPGLRDSVLDGKTGFLVPHGDVEALAICRVDGCSSRSGPEGGIETVVSSPRTRGGDRWTYVT